MTRLDTSFAALIVAQALHSVEEYFGRLWAVFPPAAFITGLISEDRRFGFIIFNILLLMFGVWCFFWPVGRRWASMAGFVAFWVVIEMINGIGHPLWALRQGGYTPGVITAPLLLFLAVLLIRNYLLHAHRPNQAMQRTAPRSDA